MVGMASDYPGDNYSIGGNRVCYLDGHEEL